MMTTLLTVGITTICTAITTLIMMLLVIELLKHLLPHLSQDRTARHGSERSHVPTGHLVARKTSGRSQCHGSQPALAVNGVAVLVVLRRSLLLLLVGIR